MGFFVFSLLKNLLLFESCIILSIGFGTNYCHFIAQLNPPIFCQLDRIEKEFLRRRIGLPECFRRWMKLLKSPADKDLQWVGLSISCNVDLGLIFQPKKFNSSIKEKMLALIFVLHTYS